MDRAAELQRLQEQRSRAQGKTERKRRQEGHDQASGHRSPLATPMRSITTIAKELAERPIDPVLLAEFQSARAARLLLTSRKEGESDKEPHMRRDSSPSRDRESSREESRSRQKKRKKKKKKHRKHKSSPSSNSDSNASSPDSPSSPRAKKRRRNKGERTDFKALIREVLEERKVDQPPPPPPQPRELPPPRQQAPQAPSAEGIVAQLVAALKIACAPPPVPLEKETNPSGLQPPAGFAEPEAAVVIPPEKAQILQFLRQQGIAVPENKRPSLEQRGLRSTQSLNADLTKDEQRRRVKSTEQRAQDILAFMCASDRGQARWPSPPPPVLPHRGASDEPPVEEEEQEVEPTGLPAIDVHRQRMAVIAYAPPGRCHPRHSGYATAVRLQRADYNDLGRWETDVTENEARNLGARGGDGVTARIRSIASSKVVDNTDAWQTANAAITTPRNTLKCSLALGAATEAASLATTEALELVNRLLKQAEATPVEEPAHKPLQRIAQKLATVRRRLQVAQTAHNYVQDASVAITDMSTRGLRAQVDSCRQHAISALFDANGTMSAEQKAAISRDVAECPFLPSSLFGGRLTENLSSVASQQEGVQHMQDVVQKLGGSLALVDTPLLPQASRPGRGAYRGGRGGSRGSQRGGPRRDSSFRSPVPAGRGANPETRGGMGGSRPGNAASNTQYASTTPAVASNSRRRDSRKRSQKKKHKRNKRRPGKPNAGEASKGGQKRSWDGGDGGAGGQKGNSSTSNPQNKRGRR